MSLTINGATNTLTAASGLTIAGNTSITGTLGTTGNISLVNAAANASLTLTPTNNIFSNLKMNGLGGAAALGLDILTGSGAAYFSSDSHTFRNAAQNATYGVLSATGLAVTGAISATGIASVTDTTDATSTTAASLKTAGGFACVKKAYHGDNIVMASGKGIDFSATADGSGTTTSEVLSDYEEGTWTPTLTFATPGDLSVSYSVRGGHYTKVGRLVTCELYIVTSAFTHTTAASLLSVTGLPFTSANLAAGNTPPQHAALRGVGLPASMSIIGIEPQNNATNCLFLANGYGTAAVTYVPVANVASGGNVEIRAMFSYYSA